METQAEQASDALLALAAACGISTQYLGHDGEMHSCSTLAMRSALAALDLDASSDTACWRSLAELDDHLWQRIVPPITVLRQGRSREIPVHVTDGDAVEANLRLEAGETRGLEQLDRYVPPRHADGRLIGRATFLVPGDLPLGWHRLEARSVMVVMAVASSVQHCRGPGEKAHGPVPAPG